MNTEQILSCDWGSSAFRLRVVDLHSLSVTAEVSGEEGIIKTFSQWKDSGKTEAERVRFYLDIIRRYISELEKKLQKSLAGLPLVICGMATSSIGMMDLPYAEVPFFADGSDLVTKSFPAKEDFPHEVLMISGARTGDDVMRGEETKVVGSFVRFSPFEQVYILPGTHAKHIFFSEGRVSHFETFMTGELFSLLSKKSILAVSVEKGGDFTLKENADSFIKGIGDSMKANCLHNFFKVRTNDLFNKLNRHQNFYYLSALLIGQQLKDIKWSANTGITLVSDENFTPLYQAALRCFDGSIDKRLRIVDAEEALLKGQCRMYTLSKTTQNLEEGKGSTYES